METYYRFIIQEALPFYSKLLYLDCDLVVNGDVAELFDTEMGDNAIAAVPDIDFIGNLNMKDGIRAEYVRKQLHMRDAYGYFQAGVLVMNLDRTRKIHTVHEWLQIASKPGYIYNDQDILNTECEGLVTYLDYSWNVMHNCAGRVAEYSISHLQTCIRHTWNRARRQRSYIMPVSTSLGRILGAISLHCIGSTRRKLRSLRKCTPPCRECRSRNLRNIMIGPLLKTVQSVNMWMF